MVGLHTAGFMTDRRAPLRTTRLQPRPGVRRRSRRRARASPTATRPSSSPTGATLATVDTYALGRSDAETRRLILQHQVYGPITRQLLTAAGITRGMKVLDLGSGAGDVALALADIVGPEGRVIGVDMNAAILDDGPVAGRGRRVGERPSSTTATSGQLDLDDDFDAVVGRWILMYVDDPADVAPPRRRPHLRPGGVVAFLESADLDRSPSRTVPADRRCTSEVNRWTTPPPGAPGPAFDMGMRLLPDVHRCRAARAAAAPRGADRRRRRLAGLRVRRRDRCAACCRSSSSSAP